MLEIRNLNVSYGLTQILKGLNISLPQGESLALIGETGTGKTTLGMSIMGLGEMTCEGDIIYQDHNLLTLGPEEIAKIRWNNIAMVFQDVEGALNPLHTIIDQVTEPMVSHNFLTPEAAVARAADLLLKVGIPGDRFSHYPHQLSSGQKQRVLIAMALANDPEVLILDEPTASLDLLTKAEIINILREIRDTRTLLVITHDLSTAAQLCRNCAVLYGGRIVEYGPAEKVLQQPRHPYTRGLKRSYPNMSTTKDLQGIPGKLSRPGQGCPFEPRCTQKIQVCQHTAPDFTEHEGVMVACHRGGIVPLLQVCDLKKSFEQILAVNEVSFTLFHGETVSIIGESGSGKTTTAKSLMGLYDSVEGAVFLQDRAVQHRDREFYRQIQLVFQNPKESVNGRFTVQETVMEPLNIYQLGSESDRLDTIKRVLNEVELPSTEEFLNSFAYRLSTGEAQRVCIARALVLDPKILVADEPTSALDPSVQAKILKLLLNLQDKRGLSILFITHDIALARKISDRILVFKEGSIVEEGPPEIVTSNPKHPYTRELLKAAPSLSLGVD